MRCVGCLQKIERLCPSRSDLRWGGLQGGMLGLGRAASFRQVGKPHARIGGALRPRLTLGRDRRASGDASGMLAN
jgi:hypothetical protein